MEFEMSDESIEVAMFSKERKICGGWWLSDQLISCNFFSDFFWVETREFLKREKKMILKEIHESNATNSKIVFDMKRWFTIISLG